MTEKELTELSGIAMIQVQNFFTKNVFPFYLPKELFFRSKKFLFYSFLISMKIC